MYIFAEKTRHARFLGKLTAKVTKMRHTERELERECVKMARAAGWVCWKNEKNGLKGIPDYSMLRGDGRFMLVEFKRPDGCGRLSDEQRTWLDRFPSVVKVVASTEEMTKLILQWR